jgi:hypothetical protein
LSPKLAYAVGLITTDGSLSSDGRHFDFTSTDIQLLKTFKKCLRINNKISSKSSGYTGYSGGRNVYHIQFGDVTLYQWCLKIGLMPNKTKKLGALLIPEKYFFDFLRGHLDGDGCIRKYQDPVYQNSQRLYVSFCSASLVHLKWLQSTINKLLTIKGFIRKNLRVYYLTYAKNDSIKLLKSLYYSNDLPCLKRKFVIAHSFL